jgi:hypothetical protein
MLAHSLYRHGFERRVDAHRRPHGYFVAWANATLSSPRGAAASARWASVQRPQYAVKDKIFRRREMADRPRRKLSRVRGLEANAAFVTGRSSHRKVLQELLALYLR